MNAAWDSVGLGDAVEFLDSQRRPVKVGDRAKIRGSIPYYGASGVVDYVNDYLFDEDLILLGEDGENILSRSVPLAFRISGKTWVNNHAHVLRARPGFDVDFLTAYLESLDYTSLNTGTAQPKLNKQSCLTVRVVKPPVVEQRRIARALGDADDYAALLERLIAKKRAIKQGMVQDLLTGRRRLPGFTGSWQTVTFRDIASPSKERVDPKNATGRVVELEHLSAGTGVLLGDADVADSVSLKTRFVKGDVLFGKLRAYLQKYWLADRDGFASTEIWALRPQPGVASGLFLRYVVEQDSFIESASTAYGTHMPRSDWKVVSRYELSLPSLEEQEAIGRVLRDADAEIEALERRLEATRAIKQGMMQELLTGRTRLVGEGAA